MQLEYERTPMACRCTTLQQSSCPSGNRWTLEDIRLAYPFHRLLFSEEAILGARVERSVVTSMGTRLYPIDRKDDSRGHDLIGCSRNIRLRVR